MSVRIYKKSEHKFFDDLVTMLSSIGGMLVTAEAFHSGGSTIAPVDKKYYIELPGGTLPMTLTWLPFETFCKIIANNWPDEIQLLENENHIKNTVLSISSSQFKNLHARHLQAGFLRYYESYKEEIEKTAGYDPYAWPEPWNFARVIRNACAHGGAIYFENLKAPGVNWQTLTYSPADNGKVIFYSDISWVEIIMLMEEMDKSLA